MKTRTIFTSLAIGIAATVAISWACALWSPLTAHTFHTPTPAPGERLGFRVRVPQDWTVRTWLERRGPGFRHDTISECEWHGSALGAGPSTYPNRTLIVVSCGWPLPAMQWTEHDARRTTLSLYDIGINPAPARLPQREYPEPRLPLRPLWAGLAVNSALGGALAAAGLGGLAALRRSGRVRGGRCAMCNYPLETLTLCPECGTPRRVPVRGAPGYPPASPPNASSPPSPSAPKRRR